MHPPSSDYQLARLTRRGFLAAGSSVAAAIDGRKPNFGWTAGYSHRFGLVHIDFNIGKRTPKLSYQWYQQVIREHRIV